MKTMLHKAVYDILKNCHWPEFDCQFYLVHCMAKKTLHVCCGDSFFLEYCSTVLKDIKEIIHNNIYQCHVPLSISNSAKPPNKGQ